MRRSLPPTITNSGILPLPSILEMMKPLLSNSHACEGTYLLLRTVAWVNKCSSVDMTEQSCALPWTVTPGLVIMRHSTLEFAVAWLGSPKLPSRSRYLRSVAG